MVGYLEGYVAVKFLEESVSNNTGLEELAFTASKGTLVHGDGHAHSGLLTNIGQKGCKVKQSKIVKRIA